MGMVSANTLRLDELPRLSTAQNISMYVKPVRDNSDAESLVMAGHETTILFKGDWVKFGDNSKRFKFNHGNVVIVETQRNPNRHMYIDLKLRYNGNSNISPIASKPFEEWVRITEHSDYAYGDIVYYYTMDYNGEKYFLDDGYR